MGGSDAQRRPRFVSDLVSVLIEDESLSGELALGRVFLPSLCVDEECGVQVDCGVRVTVLLWSATEYDSTVLCKDLETPWLNSVVT